MSNNKGSIELVISICVLFFFFLIPISCHQDIKRTQKIMAQTGVEMSYWDIFWTNPEIRLNQGKITVVDD